jgi:nucleotide-binding universal stress UspA family protein
MTPSSDRAGRDPAGGPLFRGLTPRDPAAGGSTTGSDPRGPTVVVGVDGLDASRAALAWAVRYADHVAATVRAVAVWRPPPPIAQPEWFTDEEYERDARRWLDEALAELPGGHEHIEGLVVGGEPGDTLLEHARGAVALVLGSRRHGAVEGALVGSVALHCAHHARCPLVLVPKG